MKLKFLIPSFSLRIYSLFYIEKIQIKNQINAWFIWHNQGKKVWYISLRNKASLSNFYIIFIEIFLNCIINGLLRQRKPKTSLAFLTTLGHHYDHLWLNYVVIQIWHMEGYLSPEQILQITNSFSIFVSHFVDLKKRNLLLFHKLPCYL